MPELSVQVKSGKGKFRNSYSLDWSEEKVTIPRGIMEVTAVPGISVM